ncbi:MAG TPA: transporter substrate-binding domain-containing protein [Acetobacteraceae bacterium]|jgi:polar amino acid transport system substrate-binding protein|nr:transporter substrate-binding domain-containing protein [Acetobacteraceae bacterium]
MPIGRRDIGAFGAVLAASAAAAVPALAQSAGSTWDAIRARKTVRVGVTPSEPWYAKDPASGQWSGMGAMLGQQIAKDLDATAEFVETTWANAPAGLQANQFDIMFVLDPTPARALAIDFPFAPVLYYALGFMVKEDPAPRTWAALDMPETSIAVPVGTSMDRWLGMHMKKAHVIRARTVDEAILQYQSGNARALVLYHPALIGYRLRIGHGVVVVPTPAVTSMAGAGIRREADKTWRDYLTSVLTFYYESGTIEDLYRAYLAQRGLEGSVPGITKESLSRT